MAGHGCMSFIPQGALTRGPERTPGERHLLSHLNEGSEVAVSIGVGGGNVMGPELLPGFRAWSLGLQSLEFGLLRVSGFLELGLGVDKTGAAFDVMLRNFVLLELEISGSLNIPEPTA